MSTYEPGTLGWWMNERRGELGLTWGQVADRAGVRTQTLYSANSRGSAMRTTTRKGIEYALEWESGSVTEILSGGKPTPKAPTVETPRESTEREQQIARLDATIKQLEELRASLLADEPEEPSEPQDRRATG